MLFVPVPDKLNGVALERIRVPDCAPVAIEKVEILLLFAFIVVMEPFTVTTPDVRLKTPFLIRLKLAK